MGNSSDEECDDLNDSQVNEYKEVSYKFFQFRTHRLRCSNGGFGCPFCDYQEDNENRHTHLLLHAIRVGEEGSGSRKKISNHFAMAKYLAIDLAHEIKAEADRLSKREMEAGGRVLQLERELYVKKDEITDLLTSNDELIKREKEALDKVCDLERKISEMSDDMNALVTKDRAELQKLRLELSVGEMEVADRVLQLERELKEKTEKMNDLVTSNEELLGAQRELIKREKEALDKVCELERTIDEMRDQMNALTTKEHSSNDELRRVRTELMVEKAMKDMMKEIEDSRQRFLMKHGGSDHAMLGRLPVEPSIDVELQGDRRELIKGLNGWQNHNSSGIGIKRMGEIDVNVFKRVCKKRFLANEAEIKTPALYHKYKWQEKLKNPQWYPFHMVEVEEGKFKRLLKDDDPLLQGLKEEWGQQIHDAFVEALNELLEYNPSGGYAVPEPWNFEANRKAQLDEVVSCILEAVKDAGSTSNEESCTRESEIYEHKERMYELLKSRACKVSVPLGGFRCPFCCTEEDRDYDYLLRHALMVAECSSSDAEMRGKHFALAKYLVIDLRSYAIEKGSSGGDAQDDEPSQSQSARSSPACGSDEEDSESVEETSEMNTDEEDEERDEETMKETYENPKKEKGDLERSFRNLLAREAKINLELEGAREELIEVLKDRQIDNSSEIGIKQMGEIDLNVVKRVCSKIFRASEVEIAAVALCSAWQEKLKNTLWRPFETVEDDDGKLQIVVEEDESLGGLKQIWGDEMYRAVVAALKDLYEYCPTRDHTVAELWNFKESRKAELKEAIRYYMVGEREGERETQWGVSALLLLSKSSDNGIGMTALRNS